jgi:transposase
LRETDAFTECGALGELLRRKGIYSSQVSVWRARLKQEGLAGLEVKRPGPKPGKDSTDRLIEQLEKRNAKLEKELRIPKRRSIGSKAPEILGIAMPRIKEDSEDDAHNSPTAPREVW